ncbi:MULTISPECIES: Bug family tripartite tricarboxylate transporter substrate binding protein [Nocardioides]|uniref:Bug family tripartite tricarboxylate transporter substrate binding protein n=1 Tax=Nocardioides vastitatis TaxID=2568655 RepID=A0ABW0ZKR6_9ACTN|nr:tripartite tricarboxylate transporter substrate-binding protein [Nocardioides sp.]THJ09214.1 tripartite tricarboxylate transporter substrate binding protein [Nocardioides sp.]
MRSPPCLSRRAVLGLAGLAALSGCSPVTPDVPGSLRIMVPNAPGGGYDTTARVVAEVLQEEELAEAVEVFNLEGASGAVGLARTAGESGNPDLLMMMGLGVVGALYATGAAVDFEQVTPIARLLSEPEIIAVPSDSRFDTFGDLVGAWRADPKVVKVGGGSQIGGPDHLAAHMLAESVGIDPRRIEYVRFDGGGPLLAGLFTGEVDFAVSGLGEYADHIRMGEVRVLAVTAEEQLDDLDAPTLRELGVDMDFRNWRGFVAPPELAGEEQRSLVDLISRMHETPAWQAAQRANGWTDDFLVGDEFGRFLDEESARVAALLDDLGLSREKGS